MEYKDDETDKLLQPSNETKNDPDAAEKNSPVQRALPTHPFKKWMDSFRTRKRVPPTISERYVEGWSDSSATDFPILSTVPRRGSIQDQFWERSSGRSSQLGTVKTAAMSIASQSMARSRGTTQSATTQSAVSEMRISAEGSHPISSNCMDEAVELRATKRRQVLRELLATETDYVQGMKALAGILSMFDTRPQIYHNIQRIRDIHEHFLIQLEKASPMSALPSRGEASDFISGSLSKRLGILDLPGLKGLQTRSLRTRSLKASINQHFKTLVAESLEGLEVAREIEKLTLTSSEKSASFPAYEEFCSNYELLAQDVAILRRSIPNWSAYDQGIEALSKSVASMESKKHEENRSMNLSDLMIKPIQRLCKYPLLLQDLLRHTPVSDCPSSHNGIRQILESLRILVARINSATGNPVNKDRIQKTIILQEKLSFSESFMLQDIYKELGPLTLCGVLHVTYQTPESIVGDFMVCVLFNCYLVFVKGVEDFRRLVVVACIYLGDLRTDTPQNGRGLYCYGCPFSWKLLFQDQEDSHEFVLSASSATEEKHWKMEILKCSASLAEMANPGPAIDPRKYSFVNLLLLPLDRVRFTATSLTRRSSMDSMTVSRKANVQHIIIKKTHYPHMSEEAASPQSGGGEFERPKTPVVRGALTLVARRMDRIRLERMIADVYNRDVLPMPGMVLGRGDLFRRGSIMRRLSLHAGFTKRSSSVSIGNSSPVVADARSVEEYSVEEKEMVAGHDGFTDQQRSPDPDCESPMSPTTPLGSSRTIRFRTSMKSAGSASSPRSEKGSSQESNFETPSRKKWTSPISLFNVLSPKTPKR
ncbi:hypothetical protein N7448_004559 [Penicillium atrosanguineum]|uniref:uncharacterized protein n=1 Tax=Penicillium atrosanguineum TaxID=1132637 RepID=UPI0023856AF9|nr:uncharacterized protein N7443_008310 [Penicillium atrosanguineum]KAJ5136005.1 hypothetical protein N7448_004559 [Penicillium atrosanguineum]KAJ5292357.1 hypothetical protein N7443_008310 [Penicillium atrosanguineum]